METLAEYLDRLMRQKNVTPKQLAQHCKLTDNTIARFRKGALTNPTVETILELAQALEVNAHDIFAAASGVPISEAPQIDPQLLLDQMQKLIIDTNGFEVLRQLLTFSPDERKRLLDYMEYFRHPPSRDNGKSGEE